MKGIDFVAPEQADHLLKPSRKKPIYAVSQQLRGYLKEQGREVRLPSAYADLRRFTYSVPLKGRHGETTLWETVSYDKKDWDFLREALIHTYAILKTEGDLSFINQLDLARIDYCSFANSRPFRIRIVNKFNDNYDHYYIKLADTNRIYGLELEHLLSPNRITFLTNFDTLVEEHIPGVPGDMFIEKYLDDDLTNKIRFAKEFVKFNERCFVRLLGDMRSYNFVVDITPDVEDYQYRIRAIDFDQQSYEGRRNLYLPQFFKENFKIVQMVFKCLNNESIRQYQVEERTAMAFRVAASRYRLKHLLDIMGSDQLSVSEKIIRLREELSELSHAAAYLKCKSMGQLVKTHLKQSLAKNLKFVPRVTGKYAY